MRIIGGHDYYDSALAYGRDDDILFVRNTKEIAHTGIPLGWPKHDIFYGDNYGFNGKNYHIVDKDTRYVRPLTVYVCGVRYFGVELYGNLGYQEVIWTYDKMVEYAAKYGLRLTNTRRWYRNDLTLEEIWNIKTVPIELDWLIENRIAIAVGGYSGTTVDNPYVWYCNDAKVHPLRSIQFQKVMDPYTLFQELSMFVGNLPKDGPPMVQITDPNIKIAKHGFDKWSFRRHKEDPK